MIEAFMKHLSKMLLLAHAIMVKIPFDFVPTFVTPSLSSSSITKTLLHLRCEVHKSRRRVGEGGRRRRNGG